MNFILEMLGLYISGIMIWKIEGEPWLALQIWKLQKMQEVAEVEYIGVNAYFSEWRLQRGEGADGNEGFWSTATFYE